MNDRKLIAAATVGFLSLIPAAINAVSLTLNMRLFFPNFICRSRSPVRQCVAINIQWQCLRTFGITSSVRGI